MPKSAVAAWPFHKKHDEPRDKATVIAKVILAIEVEGRDKQGEQTDRDRVTKTH